MTAGKPRLIPVKVQPRAKEQSVKADEASGLTVKVLSAPERGQANEEVRKLLAAHFGLPVSKVRIVRGEKSRHKLVSLDS